MTAQPDQERIIRESSRRRSFAIISHPDAGKTTLTEKLLLFGGVIHTAGAVRSRSAGAATKSDWMELERQRGISVSSTVLQFPYRDHVLNLLDTPGHQDFSEDTYRVLTAVDAAIMVLDSAKGIEPQTLKLFEVCRARRTPIITFLNKQDRPGLEPFELVDDIVTRLSLDLAPMIWPVGRAGDLQGLLNARTNRMVVTERTAHGSRMPIEHDLDQVAALEHAPESWRQARDECDLLEASYGGWDRDRFLAGELSPVFAGSALGNIGIRQLLDAVIEEAPSPTPRANDKGDERALTAPFSGFVFKIQANLDPLHRDRMAFIRICSGRFERGETLTHASTGKPVTTKHAATVSANERETVDEAFPGDIVALVNAKNLAIGDTLCEGKVVQFPRLPRFAPETFAVARPKDISKSKQFKTGIEQLDAEGVVQTLRDDRAGLYPMVAVVGQLQLDVFAYRMANEYNAEVILEITAHSVARRTDLASAEVLSGLGGIRIVTRSDGALLALFENPYRLERLLRDSPELVLDPVVEH